jgi:uncharacterized protein YcnI
MTHRALTAALGAALAAALATPALSHAVLERREAQPDAFYRGVIQITHGCKGSPTTSVSVAIPDGAIGARPLAKPGWTISTRRGAYPKAYPFIHGTIAEGVREITWEGGSLPDDQFDEFVFSVRLSDEFRPGEVVYFPVVQTCASGTARWTQIPAAGQDAHALEAPAPSVRIVAGAQKVAAAPGPVTAGALTIEQPWMRATPGGAKVAAGYLRITNGGSEPDRLLAASIPLAGRGEVHEMSREGAVVKMRPLDDGIEIAPGAALELKPGGYHLMFMDLKGGVKEGEAVRGTLTFQKAGTVEVTFRVGGIGAQAPASSHADH